ncbi:MAG TPA: GNAT family N-acetyltransferase [Coriobacteriia bacterium]|nr:GNAT family N-acetyltransferase [Coriobacteriia bacterium]
MRIRHAQPNDAEAIAAIYNHAVLETTATFDTVLKTPEDRRAWLAARGPEHLVIVAEDERGAVVGWGAFSPWSDRCSYRATVELSVYVDTAHLRRGIGSALAEALLAEAPALGIHVVLSRICTENAASMAMSERLGFTYLGTMHEVGRKFDRWLDVALYELVCPE